MYLLEYLKEAETIADRPYDFQVEYRLVCSGELYNRSFCNDSWRSFETARLLLERPFELYVVSRPFNHFPQDLCLRFGVNWIMDHQAGGGSIGTSPPYHDLVEDLCAVLSLLSRRLVAPAFEVRTSWSAYGETARTDSFRADTPSPIVAVGDFSNWGIRVSRAHPTGRGVTFVEHTPPALGVDKKALELAFLRLSGSQYRKELVQASRAYSSALSLLIPRPELAYQLLISAVETLASSVCSDVCPSRPEMIDHQRGVAAKAKLFGLSEEQCQDLAVEACQKDLWLTRKFKAFLTRVPSEDVFKADEVFPLADGWEPAERDINKVLGAIYNARSKYLHEAKDFPVWISHGATVAVPPMAYGLPNAPKDVPPVTWFERLVSSAMKHYFAAPEGSTDDEVPFRKA